MKKSALIFGLILFSSLAFGQQKRANCRADESNPISNTCQCDVVSSEGEATGFAFFNCDMLACEEFEPNQQPQMCDEGMRGITCWMNNSILLFNCPLMSPRVGERIEANAYCETATASIQKDGGKSPYFRFLHHQACTPAGLSYPPLEGWNYTGQFQDGWR